MYYLVSVKFSPTWDSEILWFMRRCFRVRWTTHSMRYHPVRTTRTVPTIPTPTKPDWSAAWVLRDLRKRACEDVDNYSRSPSLSTTRQLIHHHLLPQQQQHIENNVLQSGSLLWLTRLWNQWVRSFKYENESVTYANATKILIKVSTILNPDITFIFLRVSRTVRLSHVAGLTTSGGEVLSSSFSWLMTPSWSGLLEDGSVRSVCSGIILGRKIRHRRRSSRRPV